MALAALDFLAVVKPSFCSAYLRGLDRLTIQTSRRGMFVPLLFFSDARTECIVDSDPHPLELPGSQVMVDTLPLGEIGGQHTPLDPTFGDIKDGIEYGPHTQGTRSSTAFGGWDHIFDPLPFLVGQVAWIYFFVHIPILHNPRRLFRQALTNGRSRHPTASAGGNRHARSPPDGPPLAHAVSPTWARRFAGGAPARSAAALVPPRSALTSCRSP